MTQVVLSIPTEEINFISLLAKKMGWKMETRDSLLNKFVQSCPKNVDITDQEIQDEVNSVRNR